MSKSISKSSDSFGSIPRTEQNIDILDKVADKAKDAGKYVREFANDSQEKTTEIVNEFESRIRKYPFSTSAMVFFSGAILGYLFRSADSTVKCNMDKGIEERSQAA